MWNNKNKNTSSSTHETSSSTSQTISTHQSSSSSSSSSSSFWSSKLSWQNKNNLKTNQEISSSKDSISSASTISLTNLNNFKTDCLDAHNNYRKIHNSLPLQLNEELSNCAQEWANHIANNNRMEHRPNNKYGENIYWFPGDHVNGFEVVKLWYDEVELYNFNGNGGLSGKTGYFTQVVWKNSTKLGVGYAKTPKGGIYVVCNYDPPGNYQNQFTENVLASNQNSNTSLKSITAPSMLSKSSFNSLSTISPTNLNTFKTDCLNAHNNYRNLHNSPPLQLNEVLSSCAQEWANHIAKINRMEHRPNNKYGENIYWFSGDSVNGFDVVRSWYDEIKLYNFNGNGGFSGKTGHFTQVVWKNSTKLGVAYAKSPKGGIYVVANYDPPGNYQNQFKENVVAPNQNSNTSLKPVKEPSTSSNSLSTISLTNLNIFKTDCLNVHNNYRKVHNSPPLQLNTDLSNYAQEWANQIAKNNRMEHRSSNKYGENIYWFSGDQVNGSDVVKSWYDEIKFYNFNGNGGFSGQTGHFTQVVWKNSTKLGVGYAKSPKGGIYVVCNYDPPGNYQNQFKENVVAPNQNSNTSLKPVKEPSTLSNSLSTISLTNLNTFKTDCLNAHNNYRKIHNSPPLQLNTDISNYAQEWANQIAKNNRMEHRSNNKYGENIYWFSGDSVNGSDVVKSWYDEIKLYNFNGNGSFSGQTGHFTQVVWKNSTKLGVGYAKSPKGGIYVVANYDPPGNFQNQFKENVLAPNQNNNAFTSPKKSPTISSESKSSTNIDLIKFQTDCLNEHNKFRKNHGCPLLQLNEKLTNHAQEWANQIAKNNRMEHRSKNKYGENIYWSMGVNVTGDIPVKNWYKEIKDYNYENATFDMSTGHFTQVVWKKSLRLGVGMAKSSNGSVYVVCNYDPQGNFIGEINENVPRML